MCGPVTENYKFRWYSHAQYSSAYILSHPHSQLIAAAFTNSHPSLYHTDTYTHVVQLVTFEAFSLHALPFVDASYFRVGRMFTYNSYMYKVNPAKKANDRALIASPRKTYDSQRSKPTSVSGKAAKVLGFKHPMSLQVCYLVSGTFHPHLFCEALNTAFYTVVCGQRSKCQYIK